MKNGTHKGRVCCVCGKRHGATYGYKTILARAGFVDWGHGYDKAVPACVTKFLTGTGRNPSEPNMQNIPIHTEEGTRVRQAMETIFKKRS
jgi:hypothetical protein